MAKTLVITEKPSVARDIVEALGGFSEHDGYWESDAYVVTFSVGHILELLAPEDVDPVYKRWTLDTLPILPEKFSLKKKQGQSERLRIIKKLIDRDDIDAVVNACDAGREGELIFREIFDFLECTKPMQRLWLQSMTRQAIRDGFERLQPGERFDNLGSAAACRSHSDWLIGMNATRALTRRLKSRKEKAAWSAGRVQTPTLAIVVDRELEVLSHVPKPFSRIEARFEAAGHGYTGSWFDPNFRDDEAQPEAKDDRIFDELAARAIVARIEGRSGVARETRKPSREAAPPLFDLTSLQREANRRFGWSARRALNAAQRCYEAHKVLTYPRTSSRALPNDYRQTVDQILQAYAAGSEEYGSFAQTLIERGLENTDRTFDDARVSDHCAIIPTGNLPPAPLSGDDARMYDVVVRRFLGNFYPPATWTRVERITEVEGASFRSRSRTLEDAGWRTVAGQVEQEDQVLPPLVPDQTEAEGIAARTLEIELISDKTKPPPRYTEARMLSLMENAGKEIEDDEYADALRDKGLGTPATRADIIENLIAKGYMVRGSKGLRPTVKGIRLIDVLRRIQIDRLASAELTGELEFHLAQVEHGERTRDEFMEEIVRYTREIVERARTFEYEELYENDAPLGKCPRCGRPVYERSWFYRCEEVPGIADEDDCTFRIWKDKAGRYIDRETARTLLEKGETGELEGFSYRDGRIYSGILKLEDLELVLQSVQGSSTERSSDAVEYEVDEQPLAPCPMGCGSEVIETSTQFVCRAGHERSEQLAKEKAEQVAALKAQGKKRPRVAAPAGDKPCPFVLPRTVCKREITREEAEAYLRDKRTPLLSEFTSRFGRPFAAILVLKENGKHGFEFQPRGGQPAAAAEGAAAPADAATAPPPRRSRKRAKASEVEAAPASPEVAAPAAADAAPPASPAPATAAKGVTTRKRAAAKSPRKKATSTKSAARKSARAGAAKKSARRKAATKRPTKG